MVANVSPPFLLRVKDKAVVFAGWQLSLVKIAKPTEYVSGLCCWVYQFVAVALMMLPGIPEFYPNTAIAKAIVENKLQPQ